LFEKILTGKKYLERSNMPKKLEEKLKKEARKKGLRGERKETYIYGTMRKTGWKPKK